jgi:hypothetical protein
MNLAVAAMAIFDPFDNGFGAIIPQYFLTLQIYKK